MAWSTLPAISVTFVYRDASGSLGRSVAHLPAGTTLADANTAAAALVAQLLAVSDASIISYSIAYTVNNTTPAAPAAGSRVENKALLTFRANNGKPARITVPAIKAAAVAASGGIISSQTDVAALVSGLVGGAWSDSNGSSLDALVADAQVFRSTTKAQYPTDVNPST